MGGDGDMRQITDWGPPSQEEIPHYGPYKEPLILRLCGRHVMEGQPELLFQPGTQGDIP